MRMIKAAAIVLLSSVTALPAGATQCPAAAANLFRAQSWLPPPPPPPPPPKPQAPPLPFTYLGHLAEDKGIALFLGRQQRTLIVRTGDSIDGTYRVDAITAQRAVFTYLPLDIQQPLILRNRP